MEMTKYVLDYKTLNLSLANPNMVKGLLSRALPEGQTDLL